MRAIEVIRAGQWDEARARDSVALDYDRRHRRRILLRTEAGTECLLDLAEAVHLRDGDALRCEDGGLIAVRAAPERLARISAPAGLLVRLAWHLGNRHLDVAFGEGALLIRADHVIEAMAEGLGGMVSHVDAPFDPEAGAYAHGHG